MGERKTLLFHIKSGWLTTQAIQGGPDATPINTTNNTVDLKDEPNVVNYLDQITQSDLLNLANEF
jgi:hypothetical protein